MSTTPLDEKVEGDKQFPVPFGGALAKMTTQMKVPTWGQFSTGTQETWPQALGTQRDRHYELTGRVSYLLEDAGERASSEAMDTERFMETRLDLLEHGQDRLAQMIEASLGNLPRLPPASVKVLRVPPREDQKRSEQTLRHIQFGFMHSEDYLLPMHSGYKDDVGVRLWYCISIV
ncbi:UNVERIFIED_CONTAM: hypothetical protein K2H54_059972 [Gekko kuhli]